MIKVYTSEKYFYFEVKTKPDVMLYAGWSIVPKLKEWLDESCSSSWYISSDVDFNWGVHDNWMNEVIDISFRQTKLPNEPRYWPFKICKPHIVFDSPQDAVLFRLTW